MSINKFLFFYCVFFIQSCSAIIITKKNYVNPIIRYYPQKSDTLAFDNLRFFKISAVNDAISTEIVTFKIVGFYFTYKDEKFYTENSTFSPKYISKIFSEKPNRITLDTVILIDQNNVIYKKKEEISIVLTYPEENKYSCLEISKSINFKTLLKENAYTHEIIVQKSSNFCPIICFFNLGTIFNVEIKNTTGTIIYNQMLKSGEISIENYFPILDEEIYFIKISGDCNWEGQIKFNDG